jgi:hypothetical protein
VRSYVRVLWMASYLIRVEDDGLHVVLLDKDEHGRSYVTFPMENLYIQVGYVLRTREDTRLLTSTNLCVKTLKSFAESAIRVKLSSISCA